MAWNSAVSPSTLRYTGTLDPFCIYSPFFNIICSTIPPQKTLLFTSGTIHFSVLDLTDNFFLPHSTFSLQISLLSPELTLICFFSHRSPNCPTSGFSRQPTPIWSGPSFWPSLFVSPQIEIREYIDDIILCGPSLQISQTNTFAQPRLQSLIFQGPTLHASSHLLGPKHYPNPQSHHFWEKALNPVSCYPLY